LPLDLVLQQLQVVVQSDGHKRHAREKLNAVVMAVDQRKPLQLIEDVREGLKERV
jgi:hypothetical protein